MSKIKNNPVLQNVSGMLGDTVVFRKVRGKMQMANRPASGRKPSEKQEAVKLRFQEATQYARQQLAQEESRALYESGITGQKHTAHVVAVTDYLNAPRVHFIETADYLGNVGDTILVKATDDFMVTGVKIVITGSDGIVLEKGDAGPDGKVNLWKYVATAANTSVEGTKIRAIAFDRPGNKTTMEQVL